MIKILKNTENAVILVVTPLLTGHTISKETRQSINTNTVPFKWISYEGDGKHAANVQAGIDAYKTQFGTLPPYIQILDRDIICGRKMLDRLYANLKNLPSNIAFSYCSFEYRGYINIVFPPKPYNIGQLITSNYISSNSLYRTCAIEKVGGFVTETKYHRLSDWAMFLRLYNNGFVGSLCYETSFIAASSKDDISAGSREEYIETRKNVLNDFMPKRT